MSRVIITGGTGFIGSSLTQQLIREGFEVVCLTRNAGRAGNRGKSRVQFVEWDGKSAEGWGDHAEGAEAIINLAGESIGSGRWSPARKQRILQSRINSGEAIVQAVKAVSKKPEVVIQASAIGIYGNRGNEILDESSSLGEGFLAEVAKEWEKSTLEIEELGVRRVIVRSGLVLGSKGGSLPRLLLPFRFFVGGHIANGRQWMSWIHMRDEIASLLFLMGRKDLDGVFNLTSPFPIQNSPFSHELGRLLGRPSWFAVPGLLLRLVLGEMAQETILTSQRVFPVRLEESGFKFIHPQVAGALEDILKKEA